MLGKVLGGGLGDLPQFGSSNYTSTAYGLGAHGGLAAASIGNWGIGHESALANNFQDDDAFIKMLKDQQNQRVVQKIEKETEMSGRRLVQVIIVDPDDNVPIENCLLYKGEPILTESNDQELFFDLDIKNILKEHNDKRVTFHDKKIKDRKEMLQPAKIRDLKMVVVNIATF